MQYKFKRDANGVKLENDYVGDLKYNQDTAPRVPPQFMLTRSPDIPSSKLYSPAPSSPHYPWLPSPPFPTELGDVSKTTRVYTHDLAALRQQQRALRTELEAAQATTDHAAAVLSHHGIPSTRHSLSDAQRRGANPSEYVVVDTEMLDRESLRGHSPRGR